MCGKSRVEGERCLELGAIWNMCSILVQCKLPGTYEGGPNEDF